MILLTVFFFDIFLQFVEYCDIISFNADHGAKNNLHDYMGKYSNWVKKAEAPDIENYYAFKDGRQGKAVKNLFFCLFMFFLQIISGLINSPSSHSFLVFYPYIFVFLPFPFFLCASVRLFFLPDTLTKKQWDKSLGSLKHSDIGLIFTSGICLLCEIVYFFKHFSVLKTDGSFPVELLFFILHVVLVSSSVLYGFFYDKNFSGK